MLINKDAEGKIIQYNYYDGEEIGWFQISYEGNIISVVTPDVMASNGVIHVIDKGGKYLFFLSFCSVKMRDSSAFSFCIFFEESVLIF